MKAAPLVSRISQGLATVLLTIALVGIQVLIGGTRPVFSLPVYAFLGAMGLLAAFSLRDFKPKASQLCLISSIVFCGYILVRAICSPVLYLARADFYLVLAALLVYLFTACVLVEPKRRIRLLCILLLVAMVHVAIGALQFRDGTNFMLIPFLQRFDYGRRASGFYANPNHLAGLLEVLGIFALSLACWSRWPAWGKLLAFYATAVCYLGIILTGSRGGYFSAGASIFVFCALSLLVLRRAGRTVFTRIGGATFVLAGLIALVVLMLTRQSFFVSERTATGLDQEVYNRRYDLWHAAIQEWQLQPVTGTGSGTYLFYGRQYRADSTNKDPVYAHNDYLQLLAEYGGIGAITFLVFFGTHLSNGWRNFQRFGPKRVLVSTRLFSNTLALQVGALCAVAAYLVHSLVDFNLHIPANALLLAFVFGLLANDGALRGGQIATPISWSAILWRLLLPLFGIVLLTQSLRLLPGAYFAERARVALREDNPEASAAFAIQALATEHDDPNLYFYLGRAGMLEGNAAADAEKRAVFFHVAIVAFEKGWALARQDRTFPAELGAIYDALGRFPEAEWMYDEALRLDPRDQELKQAYATHLEHWQKAGSPNG